MEVGREKIDKLIVERMGGNDAAAAIKRACASLLLEAGLDRPPVRLSKLARFLGARISYNDDHVVGKEIASLKIVDDRIVLWVSRKDFENRRTRTRARFSIAHEIGHLILFKIIGPSFLEYSEGSSDKYQEVERLCDLAASHLLMPRDYLSDALMQGGIGSANFRSLQKFFDVSEEALLRSVADIVPDGLVIELRMTARNHYEEKVWRVEKIYAPGSATRKTFWLPKGCTLKHIEGLYIPDALPFDTPVPRTGLKLVRGKIKATRDAVVVRWPYPQVQQEGLLPGDKLVKSELRRDLNVGRVMVLTGTMGRLAFNHFGASTL